MAAVTASRQPWRLPESGRRWLDRAIVVALLVPIALVGIATRWGCPFSSAGASTRCSAPSA